MDPSCMRDEDLLDYIFDPTAPVRGPTAKLQIDIPKVLSPAEIAKVMGISEAELMAIRAKEVEAIQQAELSKWSEALVLLDGCLQSCPRYASAYNNRAQVYRLMGDVSKALEDLNAAIQYGSFDTTILKQAYTQRAMILLLQDDEEAARTDFEAAAKLGSSFARSQATRLNPYAKLCNQMLAQAMNQLNGLPADSARN